ncbi:hypothetical protein [Exiguobacterium aurantiacum]|uniref:RING-type E3 ubiquitin transferase n=1 Tax=Exiguobacterium aurantiacum TaxID=33987 RepID=A0ABY5FPN6_9BACL|nr:hypothetical protein [Exiguobacterium aurantiacum]UTT43339.1 hypothetical protein NMQ00_02220 [Exiguobacterium aurantiacum]
MKYEERPTEIFWRMFYVYGAIVLIGLSLALAVAPLALIAYYPVAWLIPLLVFVAIGGFGVYWFTSMFRRLFWKERHHSRYEVTATQIEGVTYRHEPGESVEQSLPLDAIQQVVFFPAIVRKTQPSPTVRFGRPTIEFCPMLAIMTEDDSMEILFDQRDLPAFEQWIQYFDERDVPLFYTPKQLYWIGANISTRWERFERLRRPEEIIPFTYTGNLVMDEQTAAGLWVETHGSERLNEGPHQAYYEKQRTIMKWTFIGTLIGIALLAGSMFAIAALT